MKQQDKPTTERSESIKELEKRWVKKNADKQIKPTEEKPGEDKTNEETGAVKIDLGKKKK